MGGILINLISFCRERALWGRGGGGQGLGVRGGGELLSQVIIVNILKYVVG